MTSPFPYSSFHLPWYSHANLLEEITKYVHRKSETGRIICTGRLCGYTDRYAKWYFYIIVPLCVQQGSKRSEYKYSSNNENDIWYPRGNTIINL